MYMSVAYAINYPLLKIAFQLDPPMVILFLRIFFALLGSLPFIILNFRRFPHGLKDNLLVFTVSMLNIVGFMGLWFVGESLVSASLSSILVYTFPIFNVLLSILFVGERPRWTAYAGLAFGFLGVVLVSLDNLEASGILGIALLILSALCWSIGTVVFKKATPHMDVGAVNVMQYVYSLPFLLFLALISPGFSLGGLTPTVIGIGAYIGIVGTYLPYLAYLLLFRNYSISKISPFFFLVPAISVILSFIFIGEAISLTTILGFVVISGGILLSNR